MVWFNKSMMHWSELYNYWFGELKCTQEYLDDRLGLWFKKNREVDEYVKRHFAPYLQPACDGKLDYWKQHPKGYLSLIILFDQIPRNSFRQSSMAYSYDSHALNLCLKGMGTKLDCSLHPIERLFFYLPLEHTEDLDMQNLSLETFKQLTKEMSDEIHIFRDVVLKNAIDHHLIIEKFGRFPHRNIDLSRETTISESMFLKTTDYSF